MQVNIGNRFVDRLFDLKNAADQKAARDCLRRFQNNPRDPSLALKQVKKARDQNIYEARANRDLRLIIHKDKSQWVVLYVNHHDEALKWAENAKVRKHPSTGMLQLIQTEEIYEKRVRGADSASAAIPYQPPTAGDAPPSDHGTDQAEPPVFEDQTDEYLLSLGVPEDALTSLRRIRTENGLVSLCEELPEDVAERLLALFVGEPVSPPRPAPEGEPLQTDDELREFVLVEDSEELERALKAPWAKWLVFLHPLQRRASREDATGPLKITGTAGTGKTVVAVHRARELCRRLAGKVLLTTFSNTLAADLRTKRDLACSQPESKAIEIGTVHGVAHDLLRRSGALLKAADMSEIGEMLRRQAKSRHLDYSAHFLRTEWSRVIVAQAVTSLASYYMASRAGRGIPLGIGQRRELWEVFGATRDELARQGKADFSELCRAAREELQRGTVEAPYEAVVVDEVQDLGPQEVLLLKAIGGTGANGLTLIGDGGQSIYPGGQSLRSLGIETRGRSHRLTVNYRTSGQIRRFADDVLGEAALDLEEEAGSTNDGARSRRRTRNLINGPQPEVRAFRTEREEMEWVASRIGELTRSKGWEAGRIGVFARTNAKLSAVEAALRGKGLGYARLSESTGSADAATANAGSNGSTDHRVRLATMHRAKGLEFRAVFIVAANDELLPHPNSVADPDDPREAQEALQRERRLVYVNLTRARELVCVSHSGPPSRFIARAPQTAQYPSGPERSSPAGP